MPLKIEREIKLAFTSTAAARAAVALARAPLAVARRLQRDVLLDTADRALLNARSALRVRVDGSRTLLTFKGPQQPSTVKAREEIETETADDRDLIAILERLGFRVAFRYEKYREEYKKDDAVIAIDETPIGTFLEIEGDEGTIEAIVHQMGLDRSHYVLESYRALYVRYCEAQGVPARDMIFPRV